MLGLMQDNKLTNAGYFLFSNNEPTVLKLAVYATDERINFIDINRIRGNIFNLIDIATTYISEHMNWKVEFDKNISNEGQCIISNEGIYWLLKSYYFIFFTK